MGEISDPLARLMLIDFYMADQTQPASELYITACPAKIGER
jgi:hypothetical protein